MNWLLGFAWSLQERKWCRHTERRQYVSNFVSTHSRTMDSNPCFLRLGHDFDEFVMNSKRFRGKLDSANKVSAALQAIVHKGG